MTTKFFATTFVAVPQPPRKLFLYLSLCFISALFSRPVLSQNLKNNWDEAMKIKPGSKLSIKTKTGQKFGRKVTTVTADSIILSTAKTPGRDVELKRQEIAEIRRKSGARMADYAALLGGAGMAGG